MRFGRAQVEAGAEVIGIGDPAASLVGPRIYEDFVWPREKRLAEALREAGARVRLHICGNTRRILDGIARLGCDIVDIDSAVPIQEAREKLGPDQVLLGGIDPVRVLRNGTPGRSPPRCRSACGWPGRTTSSGPGARCPPTHRPQTCARWWAGPTVDLPDPNKITSGSGLQPGRL